MPHYKGVYYADSATNMSAGAISAATAHSIGDRLEGANYIVPDLDALQLVTGMIGGSTALVTDLGAMFRRTSTNTEWVQFTPSQLGPGDRDIRYAKAGGAYKVATATNFNPFTGQEERFYPGSAGTGWHSTSSGLIPIRPSAVTGGTISGSGLVTFGPATGVLLSGIISPAFKRYRLHYYATTPTSTFLVARMSNAGGTITTGYSQGGVYWDGGTTAKGQGGVGSSLWFLALSGSSNSFSVEFDFYYDSVSGAVQGTYSTNTAYTDTRFSTGALTLYDGGAKDGIWIGPDLGQMLTGTVQVFGYNER